MQLPPLLILKAMLLFIVMLPVIAVNKIYDFGRKAITKLLGK